MRGPVCVATSSYKNDPVNCGSCGHTCTEDEVCHHGACEICAELGDPCESGVDVCCTDEVAGAQCARGVASYFTCQDCDLAPTAVGAFCAGGNQCCGGSPNCFVGVRVENDAPVCLSSGNCSGCTQDSECPNGDLCIKGGPAAGCCDSFGNTLCGTPCVS